RTDRRQLARSWYMFFFQIPWLPEALLGLGHARLIGDAIRRTAVRQDSLSEEDLLHLRAAACQPGALRGGINYYRAVFRSPEARALWPRCLRLFVYGDRPIEGLRERLEDWPRITAPTLLVWGEQDGALGTDVSVVMELDMTGADDVMNTVFVCA